MTALFSCDMDIYSKGRLFIQNNHPKNKDAGFSHPNKNNSECSTRRVSPESVWVNLIHTSHSYTNTHTHICTNTLKSQTSCLRAYPDMCVDVYVPKVCMGALVSSKGNTIYMKLYKNGCWNNQICQNKSANFKFWESNLKKKKRKNKDY